MGTAAPATSLRLDSKVETTIIRALVAYGFQGDNGPSCVEALRALGFGPSANTLRDALAAS